MVILSLSGLFRFLYNQEAVYKTILYSIRLHFVHASVPPLNLLVLNAFAHLFMWLEHSNPLLNRTDFQRYVTHSPIQMAFIKILRSINELPRD